MLAKKQVDPEMDMTDDMELMKDSKGVSWLLTTLDDIPKDLFKRYVKGSAFLDIGCGDGRIISLAMACGARKYHGIEVEEKFIKASNMQRHIRKRDFRDVDLSYFNVIYYFLGSVDTIPPKGDGELELVKKLATFQGALIVYHRKVSHRLQKFHDNLISEGFEEIDNEEYLRVYKREK